MRWGRLLARGAGQCEPHKAQAPSPPECDNFVMKAHHPRAADPGATVMPRRASTERTDRPPEEAMKLPGGCAGGVPATSAEPVEARSVGESGNAPSRGSCCRAAAHDRLEQCVRERSGRLRPESRRRGRRHLPTVNRCSCAFGSQPGGGGSAAILCQGMPWLIHRARHSSWTWRLFEGSPPAMSS
jgi:hypothetical protein